MDSSNTPWTEQKKMNQSTADDEIVDLSVPEDEIVDLSGTDDQSTYYPPADGQNVYYPPTDDESVDLSPVPADDQMIDLPPVRGQAPTRSKARGQVVKVSKIRGQVANQSTIATQNKDMPLQAEAARRKQAVPSNGQRVAERPCPHCGKLLPTNASFCPQCGTALVALKSASTAPLNRAAPSANAAPAKLPKRNRKSKKVLWIGLVALVAISAVFGVLNQSSARGAIEYVGMVTHLTTSATSTPQPTPAPATPIPTSISTPKVKSTPLVPAHTTAGALILLNPGVVRQGVSMGVTGTGFDPRASVDLVVKQRAADPGQPIGKVRTDRYGTFYANLIVPQNLSSGTFFIVAHERERGQVAQAAGVVAGGQPTLKLSDQVGKPGDMITVSIHGFSPDESIKVYWNTMIGQPFMTLQADGGGGVGQAPVQVPFGASGVNTFLFVGAKSQSMVAATFDLLSLYPTVKLSNYSIRAGNSLSFSGAGFGPGERVLVYLNGATGQPISVIQTTQKGAFANAGSLPVPFSLKGKQSLIFLGEQSRATVAVAWTVQPYMPSAQASTYGGLPGTAVSFYATGFARQEVVHVYIGHTQGNGGNMVSCFRTDDKGNVVNAGSYVVPGNAQGKLVFTLVGSESAGVATANMSIMAAPAPVQVPAQPPFTCPLDGSH